jgi:SRSO17 transposase
VPRDVRFRTRHELALEMLDECGGLLPHAWISGDDEMGRSSWFRQQLQARNERYLLAVPSNTRVRDALAAPPPHTGRGRPPQAPWQGVDRWAAAVPEQAWETVEVRAGEKGPIVVQAAWTLVQARAEGRPSAVVEALVVFRERQGDGSWKHDYLLSNAVLATSVQEWARVFKAQHRIEECLQRAKGEAGLADYQVRSWEGWHHHQTLALLATWFLAQETRRGKNPDPGVDSPTGPDTNCGAAQPSLRQPASDTDPSHREPSVASQRRSTVLSLEETQPLATATL